MIMRYVNSLLFVSLLLLLFACGNDGQGGAPDIPDDPEGTRNSVLTRGGAALYLDDTGNGVTLGEDGCLQGENIFFAPAAKCDGISYITRISGTSWNVKSSPLRQGYGFVMGSKMADGATFTSIYVDEVDEATGKVTIKSLSPFNGDADKFYFNHKNTIFLYREPGDTTVVMIKPASYNVELAKGEWADVQPHITYVRLNFKENNSRLIRTDTLIYSNGVFSDVRIPIAQLYYSRYDTIFPFAVENYGR